MASDVRCQTTRSKYSLQNTRGKFLRFCFTSLCAHVHFKQLYVFKPNEIFHIACLQKTRQANFSSNLCLRNCWGLPLCVRKMPHAAVQSAETMWSEAASCTTEAEPFHVSCISQLDVLNRENFFEENTCSKNSSHGDLSQWGKQSSLSSNSHNQAIQ